MYKMTINPPAGNFVTQIAEHVILEVEVLMADNRDDEKPAEDFVFFLEDDGDFTIKERCEEICKQMGYTLKAIGEYRRRVYTYDVGKTMIRLAQQ